MQQYHSPSQIVVPVNREKEANFASMRAFVEARDGLVRFDDVAAEHLAGQKGYHSRQHKITRHLNKPDGLSTSCATDPKYRELMAGTVMQFIVLHLQVIGAEESFGSRPLTFCELGGGNGEFKNTFLTRWGRDAEKFKLPKLEYVSVDINPNHRADQSKIGGRVVAGSAIETTLADKSIDVLFDEEVLDCLPFRIFAWDADRHRIKNEIYVKAQGSELVLSPEPRPRDRLAERTEAYLAESGFKSSYYRYAPSELEYIRESARVLRYHGLRLCSDYTEESIAMALGDSLADAERILREPYTVGLTRGVDFERFARLSRAQQLPGESYNLGEAFGEIVNDQRMIMKGIMRRIFRAINLGQ